MTSRGFLRHDVYSTLSSADNVVTDLPDLTTPAQKTQHGLPLWESGDNLVSPQERDLAILILRCGFQKTVMIFGIPGNILNLAVFAKVRKILAMIVLFYTVTRTQSRDSDNSMEIISINHFTAIMLLKNLTSLSLKRKNFSQ